MAETLKPRRTVTVGDEKLGLQFDVNSNRTKMGVKLQFVLGDEEKSPELKKELTQKISTVLQKKFGDAGIVCTLDDRTPYENVIGFTIPLESIATHLTKISKGEHK